MFFRQLFLCVIIVGFAAAKVPSYVHICGRRNPKLNECVIESVTSLTDQLRAGIPELEVPPADPLRLTRVVLADMPNFKIVGTDVNLHGITNFHMKSMQVDIANQVIEFEAVFDEAKMDAMCNITAKILVPIAGSGPMTFSAKNVYAKIRLTFKLVEHGGKKYSYYTSMSTKLDLNDYNLVFHPEHFDKTLGDAVNQALGSSHNEVLKVTKPNLEKAISEKCLEMANKISKHFTFDELFPDRE